MGKMALVQLPFWELSMINLLILGQTFNTGQPQEYSLVWLYKPGFILVAKAKHFLFKEGKG
jgi:hypothetical protein